MKHSSGRQSILQMLHAVRNRSAPSAVDTEDAGYPALQMALPSLSILVFAGFLTSLDEEIVAIFIEPMKHIFSLTDFQMSLLQGAALAISYALASIPVGRIIDKGNRTKILAAAMFIWSFDIGATAFAHSFVELILLRIALGVTSAALVPTGISLISDFFAPKNRSLATSSFAVGQNLGGGFGILLTAAILSGVTLLSQRSFARLSGVEPWRCAFFLSASVSLISVPLLVMLREPIRRESGDARPNLRYAIREIWRLRAFLAPLVGGVAMSQFAVVGASVWMAPALMRLYGQSPIQFAGWLSAVRVGSGLVGPILAGLLAEWGRRREGRSGVLAPAIFGTLCLAPCTFFAVAPTVFGFGFLVCIFVLAKPLPTISGVIAVSMSVPNELRGITLGGAVFFEILIGSGISPTAVAIIGRVLGGDRMLGDAIALVCGPAALLAAFLFWCARRTAINIQAKHSRAFLGEHDHPPPSNVALL